MNLSPLDRLRIHLILYHPKVQIKHICLSSKPGFLITANGAIDIRGASYGDENPKLRLWNELHDFFKDHVTVISRKNGRPTHIAWNGNVFHLDQTQSFKHNRIRR